MEYFSNEEIKNALGANHMMSMEEVAADRLSLINELAAAKARIKVLEGALEELGIKTDALLSHCDKDGGECRECSKIICPHKDEMHFHHDGCPSCAEDSTPPAPGAKEGDVKS